MANFDLKTIIYNGNVNLLNSMVAFDHFDLLALGLLDQNELKLLRNSIYAKYGYKFKSAELSDHFGKFPWYKAQNDNVDAKLTENEKHIIDQIKLYENGRAAANGLKNNLHGRWDEFNGGADQAASSIDLNLDGSFIFRYGDDFPKNILSVSGKWKYHGSMLSLTVTQLALRLGGYIVADPSGYEMEDSQKFTLIVDGQMEAQIPIFPAAIPKNYPEGLWLSVGGINMRQAQK